MKSIPEWLLNVVLTADIMRTSLQHVPFFEIDRLDNFEKLRVIIESNLLFSFNKLYTNFLCSDPFFFLINCFNIDMLVTLVTFVISSYFGETSNVVFPLC
jgi:hypothetical protein